MSKWELWLRTALWLHSMVLLLLQGEADQQNREVTGWKKLLDCLGITCYPTNASAAFSDDVQVCEQRICKKSIEVQLTFWQ